MASSRAGERAGSYRLRVQALVALLGFLLLVAAFALLQLRSLVIAEGNHRVLGELKLLEATLPALEATVTNYDANAPRDYASYFRDVAVFLFDLEVYLDRIETDLTAIETAFRGRVGVVVPGALQGQAGRSRRAQLEASVVDARAAWNAFRRGLDEQLGPDEEEPRLEFGAEFVAAELAGLDRELMAMSKRYRAFLDDQRRWSRRLVQLALGLLLVVGLVGVVWFYRRVVARIGRTADACGRVARGEFGYTLPVEGRDEIAELSRAFNSLSSRSELVVRMLGSLQDARTVDAALAAVVNASGTYLPVAWVGVLRSDPRDRLLELVRALPAASPGQERRVSGDAGFGAALFESLAHGEPTIVNDLATRAEGPGEAFLASLHASLRIESLVALPLRSPQGGEALLLFGSRSARYAPHQIDLLRSLAPTIATSFRRVMARGASGRRVTPAS